MKKTTNPTDKTTNSLDVFAAQLLSEAERLGGVAFMLDDEEIALDALDALGLALMAQDATESRQSHPLD